MKPAAKILSIRVTPAQHRAVKAAAKTQRVTINALVLRYLRPVLGK